MNTTSMKTHHANSKVITTKKRRNTLFYRIKLRTYNNYLEDLPNPSEFEYLDNIDTYIEYSQKQTKLINNYKRLMKNRRGDDDD